MAGHYASADVGHLLDQANLVLKRGGTQTVLRLADVESTSTVGVQQRRGALGFARQMHESERARRDRWITRPTEVPQHAGGPGFRCQVFEIWRARQDLNPRPPGS